MATIFTERSGLLWPLSMHQIVWADVKKDSFKQWKNVAKMSTTLDVQTNSQAVRCPNMIVSYSATQIVTLRWLRFAGRQNWRPYIISYMIVHKHRQCWNVLPYGTIRADSASYWINGNWFICGVFNKSPIASDDHVRSWKPVRWSLGLKSLCRRAARVDPSLWQNTGKVLAVRLLCDFLGNRKQYQALWLF